MSVLFLIKVILFTDDTKMVNKYIISQLLTTLNEENLMENKTLLKIFMNIISPFNGKINKGNENQMLKDKSDISNKKDESKRYEELVGFIINDLTRVVNLNLRSILTDNTYSNLLIDLVERLESKTEYSDLLKELLTNTIKYLTMDTGLLFDKVGQFTLNKLMKHVIETDKELENEINFNFFQEMAKLINTDLKAFLETKAVFLIVKILEHEKTKPLLLKDVKKFKNEIIEHAKKEGMVGHQLLSKLI